jgi:carboxylesterase type B
VVPFQVLNSIDGPGVPVLGMYSTLLVAAPYLQSLVWIYGGGTTAGDKSGINGGNPSGLLDRANDTIIFVSINYRLGAFGWMSGPEFTKDGTPNAGLYDQRLALKWVQEHISKFGGDPGQVTGIGESAGGGTITHHITACGGNSNETLFQRAIPQSPGYSPIVSVTQQNDLFESFLKYANVSDLDELRQLDSAALITANQYQVGGAPYGSYTFGPAVDGDLVPELPFQLLAKGKFDKSIRVMVGHNSNEGLLFTNADSASRTKDTFKNNTKVNLPSLSDASLDYLANVLYPPIYNGSQGYKDPTARQAALTSDLGFLCNVYALTKYTTDAYEYEFAIWPGVHGQDVSYTFDTDGPLTLPFEAGPLPSNMTQPFSDMAHANNVMVKWDDMSAAATSDPAADSLQDWIISFTTSGKPKSVASPAFPLSGPDRKILKLTADNVSPSGATDDIRTERCEWIIAGSWINTE